MLSAIATNTAGKVGVSRRELNEERARRYFMSCVVNRRRRADLHVFRNSRAGRPLLAPMSA